MYGSLIMKMEAPSILVNELINIFYYNTETVNKINKVPKTLNSW